MQLLNKKISGNGIQFFFRLNGNGRCFKLRLTTRRGSLKQSILKLLCFCKQNFDLLFFLSFSYQFASFFAALI